MLNDYRFSKIFPHTFPINNCEVCGKSKGETSKYFFMGMHWLISSHCSNCGHQIYLSLKYGHFKSPLFVLSKENNFSLPSSAPKWLYDPLVRNIIKKTTAVGEITKIGQIKAKNVVLLNCLDSCYGHVIWKLLNVEYSFEDENEDIDIIVVIPKSIRWMLPEKVKEAWLVDVPYQLMDSIIDGFDDFVKNECTRFEKVWLHDVDPKPDHTKVDLTTYFKTPKYELQSFDTSSLQITFILREDRFWLAAKWQEFFYLACLKFKVLKFFRRYFVSKQNRWYSKLANILHQDFPKTKLIATGLGKTGKLSSLIKDHRSDKIDEIIEKQWCDIYSQSFLVVGVHGSGMIIPTALSGGFVEIVPNFKLDHKFEDIMINHNKALNEFLGRHFPDFSTPFRLAEEIKSIINHFPNKISL